MSSLPRGVTFVLKDKNSKKPTPIILLFIHDKTRTKIYTGESIDPGQWNFDDQKAFTRGFASNVRLNRLLELYAAKLWEFYTACKVRGVIPNDNDLRESIHLEIEEEETVPVRITTLWDVFSDFVTIAEAKGKERSAQVYRALENHLRSFEKAKKETVSFDTIDLRFFDKFTTYLLNKVKLTDNTIAKQISTLKRILTFATERGYNSNLGYQNKKFNWQRKETPVIALTAEEVEQLENLTIPANKTYLENARNLFLLGIYTGLRYGDLSSIRPEHVRPDHLRIITHKTKQNLSIPLTANARQIIDLYLAGLVRPISNQRLNDYIKEVCELAQINAPTEKVLFRGGERICKTVPKWKLLGSHSGRKSFVTLSLEKGLRPQIVMAISGHKDYKSFKRYISITDDQVMKEFSKVNEMPEVLKKAI
ncbi:site-specific integrase [Cytophagaceae bacterium YF14B1]|uniref:Site-specific integrase n=1 Tax=Xanthocytophaga flava TaxID=3048013 RepID=A0AAE3U5Z4_9BACT|nr:site-specific integrase [Xanthocytophaga flavus]MDJ1481319.1 site-specific integrase [Xanthocytophaga flavus]